MSVRAVLGGIPDIWVESNAVGGKEKLVLVGGDDGRSAGRRR